MLRVVLDTNIIVSGLISPSGSPHQLLSAFRKREFSLVVSRAIIAEVEQVLQRPYFRDQRGITAKDIVRIKRLLLKRGLVVRPQTCGALVPDDPGDDPILACALEGQAEFLVTGDHHLLKLQRVQDTRIVTPREFLAILDARPRQE